MVFCLRESLIVFVWVFNRIGCCRNGESDLTESCITAVKAWQHMQQGWSPKHVLHVRTHLSKALFFVPVETVAYAINPAL